jgi:hypothetical protein
MLSAAPHANATAPRFESHGVGSGVFDVLAG